MIQRHKVIQSLCYSHLNSNHQITQLLPYHGEDLSEMWLNSRAKFHARPIDKAPTEKSVTIQKRHSELSVPPILSYGGIKTQS